MIKTNISGHGKYEPIGAINDSPKNNFDEEQPMLPAQRKDIDVDEENQEEEEGSSPLKTIGIGIFATFVAFGVVWLLKES